MELTEAQDDRIAPLLPAQRAKVRVSNLPVLNALLYGAEQGWASSGESRLGPVRAVAYPRHPDEAMDGTS